MPFRPKIISEAPPPVDETGEVELPAELADLAGKLQREAQRLAECYPASPGDLPLAVPRQDSRGPTSGQALRLAAPLLTTCLLVGGWLVWTTNQRAGDGPAVKSDSVVPVVEIRRTVAGRSTVRHDTNRHQPFVLPLTPASLDESWDYQGTGPELELFLDYLDLQSPPGNVVSM